MVEPLSGVVQIQQYVLNYATTVQWLPILIPAPVPIPVLVPVPVHYYHTSWYRVRFPAAKKLFPLHPHLLHQIQLVHYIDHLYTAQHNVCFALIFHTNINVCI